MAFATGYMPGKVYVVSPFAHSLRYNSNVPLALRLFETPCTFSHQQVSRCNNSYCGMNNSSHHLNEDGSRTCK